MKLWQKNFLAAVTVSLATLFLVCAVLIVQNDRRIFEAARLSAEQRFLSVVSAVETSAAVYPTDVQARQAAMARALSVSSALGDGAFFMTAGDALLYGDPAAFPLPAFPEAGETPVCAYVDAENGAAFLCAVETSGCRVYGVWDGESIRTEGRKTALGMGITVLGAAGLLAAVLYALSRRMFRPLAALEKGAREIAAGQYQLRLPPDRTQDVNALARSFNEMAQSVEGHIAALEAENERQRRFVRDLAHEMKTPMTAMMGYSDLMLAGKVAESERQEACRYISQQSRRLNELSQKLMELARLEQGGTWEKAPVSLAGVFRAAAETVGPMLQKKGVSLLLPAGDAALPGDETLLCALAANLLTNACKYSPEGGTVRCDIRDDDQETVLSVADQGPGVPEEALSMLTEAFFMVDRARARRENGAGVGLTLCDRIARLHGGKMRFENLRPGFRAAAVFPKNAEPAQNLQLGDNPDTNR